MQKEGCSVWILPQLVAPKTDLNQARVVGETVTQTEQNRESSFIDSSTETAKPSSGNGRLFFDSRRFKNCPAVWKWSDFDHCRRQLALFSSKTSITVHLNMSERENGQLPLAKPPVRNRISSERWEQIKTAHASGIGLREIARNMDIPEGTVLARAKRDGWTREIQNAKALVKREDASPAVTPVQAVAATMQQRGGRHLERMAGVSERGVDHIETMDGPEILNSVDQIEKLDKVARRTFGLNDVLPSGFSLNVLNLGSLQIGAPEHEKQE